ncbi:serine/threonine-protein kinase kin-29-like isoform X2 [Maniola jurtina]|uniref:serine/threonine-protein kinase kin-29-like isoform X2 n=1 Tax=Maniola jurtina TaxID=191418 RepID=UPI001E68CD08|nr:serine/threonine-protein kinase kin-29-like isoform X2 [Maniola jurtina]
MGNSHHKNSEHRNHKHSVHARDGQAVTSQFSLSHFVGNLSGRSFVSVTSSQSVYSASRPWSRISRRRWNDSTLRNPLEASKTAWPVAHKESIFLPEFPITTDLLQKDFEIIETVAKGAFGEVVKVKKLSENKEYALKVLHKAQVVSENAVRQVKEEARIQAAVGHHIFIAGAVSRWQTKKRLYIVSEYIPGGELLALLDKYSKLPEELVKIFLAEIAIAIDFLHNAGVIYRDLKPENILLDSDYHIQLVDFGLSKWLSIGSRTTTLCGTLKYMGEWSSLVHSDRCSMNARSIDFGMSMEGEQVGEVLASIFHTVLFHRSSGKFTYNNEESYSIRTVSYVDVDCDFIDFTYVCCESRLLVENVEREIARFSSGLRGAAGRSSPPRGSISLEFFQKRRARWPFQQECVPWEVWTVCCELVGSRNEQDKRNKHENLIETLQEKIVYITETINRHEYVPKMPSRSDADLIFDTAYPDIQPYLFKIHYNLSDASSSSVSNTVKKILSVYSS